MYKISNNKCVKEQNRVLSIIWTKIKSVDETELKLEPTTF